MCPNCYCFVPIKKEYFGELSGAVISNQTNICTMTHSTHMYTYAHTVHALYIKWNPVHTCTCTAMDNAAAARPLLRWLLIEPYKHIIKTGKMCAAATGHKSNN